MLFGFGEGMHQSRFLHNVLAGKAPCFTRVSHTSHVRRLSTPAVQSIIECLILPSATPGAIFPFASRV